MPISPVDRQALVQTVAADLASGADRRIIAEQLVLDYELTPEEVRRILSDARAAPRPAASERQRTYWQSSGRWLLAIGVLITVGSLIATVSGVSHTTWIWLGPILWGAWYLWRARRG